MSDLGLPRTGNRMTGEGDDRQTGRTGLIWNDEGVSIDGPPSGARLDVVFYTYVYWFAWSSHHPDTTVAQ